MPTLSIGQAGRAARAATLVAVLCAWRAEAQQPATGYRAGWGDAAVVAGLAALSVVPFAAGLPDGPPDCVPCDPDQLWGIDRRALGATSSAAANASDVLVFGVMGGAAVAALAGAPAGRRAGNAAVFGETITAAYAATGWLKVAVGRERPVLYTADARAVADDPDNQRSFPSSHTAAAFAAAVSYLVVSGRQQLPHRTRNSLLLFAGAATVGALRVAGGRHFPTDVVGGAAVGALVGWLVPSLHP